MRRFVSRRFGVALIYSIFLLSLGLYLRARVIYKGIESWPSTEATLIGSGGDLRSTTSMSRVGLSTHAIDTRYLEYEYIVEGKLYRSSRMRADGGLPTQTDSTWRAYYNPSVPEISVLDPTPYQGSDLLSLAGVFGVLAGVHLCFAVFGSGIPPNSTKH
jgi:hypothetical protein